MPPTARRPAPDGPTLRFVSGEPSVAEIAAVTAALMSLRRASTAGTEDRPTAAAPRWTAPVHYRPPGSWAAR
ncbi:MULTISPECIES: acyl-CoA carboxylase epsilon subunit [unclassified Streptomyces]|uniref:acyl-CoA carboxylase epsilon subunit n=1 Tax=unclassified Streptomyces TaxID=2593676 RepID=UPI002E7A5E99|nr:acyl-CoA carboxylase epsilon subunit [Streptomyces sp. JV185]MEE1773174.1 acyl-CoA carboxylase epsilon subunit [Streptomyces sp. JV185]